MHANQERRGPRLPRHATPHHRNTSVRKLSATVDIDFEIGKLNLTRQQIDDLVAFLGRPLVDVLHVVFAEVAAAIVERSICGVSEDGVGSRTVDA